MHALHASHVTSPLLRISTSTGSTAPCTTLEFTSEFQFGFIAAPFVLPLPPCFHVRVTSPPSPYLADTFTKCTTSTRRHSASLQSKSRAPCSTTRMFYSPVFPCKTSCLLVCSRYAHPAETIFLGIGLLPAPRGARAFWRQKCDAACAGTALGPLIFAP